MKINSKVPAEVIPVIFDYSNLLTAITSVVQIGITVITGVDPAVNTMLLGSATISGTNVVQLVRNGVAGVTYRLNCLVAVGSNERYQIDGDMAVKTWHTL